MNEIIFKVTRFFLWTAEIHFNMKRRQSKAFIFYVFIREIFWINIPSPWNGWGRTVGKCVHSNVLYAGAGILGHAASAARTSVTAISWSSWSLACYRSACLLLGAGIFSFHVFFRSGGPSCLSALKLHQYNVYLPLDCLQQRPRQNGPE